MDRGAQRLLLGGKKEADLTSQRRGGTVAMLSQLTTPAVCSPLARPTGTSVDKPRTVVMIGASVTRVSRT